MNLSFLKETFANFVRAHGMEHHFRRLEILDMFRATPAAKEFPPSLAQVLIDASDTPPGTLLARLGSRPERLRGLEQGRDA